MYVCVCVCVWYTYSFSLWRTAGPNPKVSIVDAGSWTESMRTCVRSISYNILHPQLYHLYLCISLFESKYIEITWTSFTGLCLLPNRLEFRFRTTLWANISDNHQKSIFRFELPCEATKSVLNFVPLLSHRSNQRTLQVLLLRMCWCRARHKLHHLL